MRKVSGVDDVMVKRKEQLLRGNGNITAFFAPVDGMYTCYQRAFKGDQREQMQMKKVDLKLYQSHIMSPVPDPKVLDDHFNKKSRYTSDLGNLQTKLGASR